MKPLFCFILVGVLVVSGSYGSEKDEAAPSVRPGYGAAACRRAVMLAELQELSWAEALATCEETVRKHAKDPYAYRYRAIAFARKGDVEKQAADIEMALEQVDRNRLLGADAREGFRSWAGSMYDDLARQYFAKGQWQQAVSAWSRTIDLNPGQQEAVLYRGVARQRAGNCAEAVADFDRFPTARPDISNDPATDEAVFTLTREGECYVALGNTSGARAAAHRIVELDPRLGAKFASDEALQIFQPGVRSKSMEDAAAAARAAESNGNVLEAFRKWDEARQWPEVLDTGRLGLFYSASFAQLLQESRDALLRLYPKLSVKPVLPEQARQFGIPAEREAEAAKGAAPAAGSATPEINKVRYLRAIALFGRALEIAPWWPGAYRNRALLEARLEQYSAAVADMKTYLALWPDAPDARSVQDSVYQWQAELGMGAPGGVSFDPKSLVDAWSGPLYFYSYHARIAPDPNGGVRLMLLDEVIGKRVTAYGEEYRLQFDGRKFTAVGYDGVHQILGGEVSPTAETMNVRYNYCFMPFFSVHFKCEEKQATWHRGTSQDNVGEKANGPRARRERERGKKL